MKINLASGQRPFKTWTNIDAQEQGYQVEIIADAKKIPLDDKVADIIVAHHLVEHIAIHELQTYVAEWFRILKNGGKLAVFVPNLKELDKAWIEGRVDTYIHNVNTYGAWQGSNYDLHKWGYDKQELIDRMSGWDGNHKVFEWQTREITRDVLNEPLYQGSDCVLDWWILAIEFTK